MRKCNLIAILAVLLVAAQLVAQPTPVTAGVVDMFKVLNQHPETKQRMEVIKKDFEAAIEKLKAAAGEAKALDDQLDLLKEGSPEHLERLKQLSQLKATFELDRKLLIARMNLDTVTVMRDIYEKSAIAVGEVAKAKGLRMVFMTTTSKVGGRSEAEVMNEIASRPVIWSDASLDITEAVIAALKG